MIFLENKENKFVYNPQLDPSGKQFSQKRQPAYYNKAMAKK
jgi:hypothetical protein